MSSILYSLIQNFIIGGSIIASISYLGTFFDPLIGAIWWSFPISLLPTLFFMKKHGKDDKYIAKIYHKYHLCFNLIGIKHGRSLHVH